MPFCSKCGAQIVPGDRFCAGCGSPVEASAPAPVPPVAQQGDIRQASIAEIDRLIRYFSQKQAQYDEYDICCEKITFYSNPRSSAAVKGGSGTLFLVFGLIMAIGGGTFSYYSLIVLLAAYQTVSQGKEFTSEYFMYMALFLIPLVVFILGAVFIILSIIKRRSHNRKVKSEKERLLAHYEERSDALVNELITHFRNYGNCPVEAAFTNPRVLSLMHEALIRGRADTIKNAIYVLFMDSRHSDMELQAGLAARSAASAARGAQAAAFYSASSFSGHLYG